MVRKGSPVRVRQRAYGKRRSRAVFRGQPVGEWLVEATADDRGRWPMNPEVVKAYPPRGPLQQVRLAKSEELSCFRCGQTKRSKLHALYERDWDRRLCNGCYGRLLSIYEVKAGTAPDDERADELANALLQLVDADSARRVLRERDLPLVDRLSPEAQRFIATAEYVAGRLSDSAELEWSPAVIGLCKAVEVEVLRRVAEPWRAACITYDLSGDVGDEHIGRVAKWCAGRSPKPPELGTIAYTLRTLARSSRHQSTALAEALRSASSRWSGRQWVVDDDGLADALDELTRDHRNRAAHLDALDAADYQACRAVVMGERGLLAQLCVAAPGA